MPAIYKVPRHFEKFLILESAYDIDILFHKIGCNKNGGQFLWHQLKNSVTVLSVHIPGFQYTLGKSMANCHIEL